MTIRPVPGPWRVPPPFRPRYADTPDAVEYTAQCDRCGRDAAWTRHRDAIRPTCTCTCQPEEGAA